MGMNERTNVAVIFYSEAGSIRGLAEAAAEGAREAGADVRFLSADDAATDDMEWADVVLFGTPSHYGTIAARLKTYIDSTGDLWRAGRLADKVYGAFVSSASTHGGQETTLTNFTTIFTHWGGIIVPPGFTAPVPADEQMRSGNPHGAGHVAGFGDPPTEFALAAARYQAGRAVGVAVRLRSAVPDPAA
ncbi:NAD(P)H-dependent oxidoreductase [Tsukamurella sp. 8F]|uniref:NAD(P)H-dependent oxidoreductase n=1 Tax=unclassified Tsukamurella TaxID=2633480 RepID=UPI0023B8B889|nr:MULTISPECIES: NAD(P)H-dependent oxidoreductase [unclassified Tsukamurella]MDF0529766.1 NAD(P)H-dependent oxidoreductase [Tsukamurella sp. 8J]MDF0586051.1 NAD(P)H-dependent oxidoreductase [Tsukamurella sp. 8F]